MYTRREDAFLRRWTFEHLCLAEDTELRLLFVDEFTTSVASYASPKFFQFRLATWFIILLTNFRPSPFGGETFNRGQRLDEAAGSNFANDVARLSGETFWFQYINTENSVSPWPGNNLGRRKVFLPGACLSSQSERRKRSPSREEAAGEQRDGE